MTRVVVASRVGTPPHWALSTACLYRWGDHLCACKPGHTTAEDPRSAAHWCLCGTARAAAPSTKPKPKETTMVMCSAETDAGRDCPHRGRHRVELQLPNRPPTRMWVCGTHRRKLITSHGWVDA